MQHNLSIDFSQTAQCNKCDEVKDIWTEYYWRKSGRRSSDCKVCVRAHQRQTLRDKYKDPAFRERYRGYQSAYRKANSCDPLVRLKAKERETRHKKKCPQSAKEKNRRWRERHPEEQLWRGARGRAKKKGIEFTITREWILDRIAKGYCEVTGIAFCNETFGGRCGPYSPSIDRIDSSRGYTPDNCRLICWALNMGLSEWGEEVYLRIAKEFIGRADG